jgi:hypothetical protein
LLTSIRRFKLRSHQPPASSPGTHALKNAPLSADLKSAENAGEEIGVPNALGEEGSGGESYLQMMRSNVTKIVESLK